MSYLQSDSGLFYTYIPLWGCVVVLRIDERSVSCVVYGKSSNGGFTDFRTDFDAKRTTPLYRSYAEFAQRHPELLI
jgi:hypothetical protein